MSAAAYVRPQVCLPPHKSAPFEQARKRYHPHRRCCRISCLAKMRRGCHWRGKCHLRKCFCQLCRHWRRFRRCCRRSYCSRSCPCCHWQNTQNTNMRTTNEWPRCALPRRWRRFRRCCRRSCSSRSCRCCRRGSWRSPAACASSGTLRETRPCCGAPPACTHLPMPTWRPIPTS